MKKEIRQQYEMLISFLGKVLGPCYEIVLHEIKGEEIKMLSIANGEISNRIMGSPISEKTRSLLKEKVYEKEDLVLNEIVILKNSKKLRSSTLFIKDNGKVVGMLCINFDDTQFNDLTNQLLRIIHPDIFLQNFLSDVSYNLLSQDREHEKITDTSVNTIDSLMEKIFQEIKSELNLPLHRLSKQEKEKVIQKLYKQDFFKLKSSIPFLAKKLNCSITTMYRYVASYSKKKLDS